MTATLTPEPTQRTGRGRWLIGPALVLVVFVASSALGYVFGALVLMAFTARWCWRHPGWSAVALLALLPVNRFLILLVFHFGHSTSLTTLSQAWKDLLIGLLFLRALHDLILHRRPRLRYLDIVVIAFLVVSVVYLGYSGDPYHLSLTDRLLGFRADSYFMLAYFVGRGITLTRTQVRWLLLSFTPGAVITSAIAVAQFIKPDYFNNVFNKLGFAAFIDTQSALAEGIQAVPGRGINGAALPRASSLLLGDLALAFYSILAIAIAAALFFTTERPRGRLLAGGLLVLNIAALTATVTRSAMIAATVMVLVMALLTRSWLRLASVTSILAAGALTVLASGLISVGALSALSNPHEASVQGHQAAIAKGLSTALEQPIGRGFGTVGTIGQRVLGYQSLTTENWYLQIAVEIGLVPGLLFLAASVLVGIEAWRAYLRVRDLALRRLTLVVAGASIGYLILGNMLHVWEVPVIAESFWLLGGIAVSAGEREDELVFLELEAI